jgi:hypothetical protein
MYLTEVDKAGQGSQCTSPQLEYKSCVNHPETALFNYKIYICTLHQIEVAQTLEHKYWKMTWEPLR